MFDLRSLVAAQTHTHIHKHTRVVSDVFSVASKVACRPGIGSVLVLLLFAVAVRLCLQLLHTIMYG